MRIILNIRMTKILSSVIISVLLENYGTSLTVRFLVIPKFPQCCISFDVGVGVVSDVDIVGRVLKVDTAALVDQRCRHKVRHYEEEQSDDRQAVIFVGE